MNNHQLARQFDELELALVQDDPSLSKRFRNLQQRSTRNDVAVFSLLTLSAVLLAAGLGSLSPFAWGAGVAAYVASFIVDNQHERTLRGPSQDATKEPTWR